MWSCFKNVPTALHSARRDTLTIGETTYRDEGLGPVAFQRTCQACSPLHVTEAGLAGQQRHRCMRGAGGGQGTPQGPNLDGIAQGRASAVQGDGCYDSH